MSNFDTHDEATRLADCHSRYALAKMVIELRKEHDKLEAQWYALLSQTPECSDCRWHDNVKRKALQSAVARRDLIKQAEALEDYAGLIAGEYEEGGLLQSAEALRQQASQLEANYDR